MKARNLMLTGIVAALGAGLYGGNEYRKANTVTETHQGIYEGRSAKSGYNMVEITRLDGTTDYLHAGKSFTKNSDGSDQRDLYVPVEYTYTQLQLPRRLEAIIGTPQKNAVEINNLTNEEYQYALDLNKLGQEASQLKEKLGSMLDHTYFTPPEKENAAGTYKVPPEAREALRHMQH